MPILFSLLLLLASCETPEPAQDGLNVTRLNADTVAAIAQDIRTMFQDARSRYWFGSDGQGVFCYDGTRILRITTKHGLCNDRVRQILEDRNGAIYVNTLNGISRITDSSISTLAAIEMGASPAAWKSAPDDLWFLSSQEQGGTFRYDGRLLYHLGFPKNPWEDAWRARYPNVPFSPYQVYTIYKDDKGNIWFGTASLGACRYDGKHLSWLYEDHLTETPEGGSFGIRSIIQDRSGKFWLCNNRYRYAILAEDSLSHGQCFLRYRKEPGAIDPSGRNESDFTYAQTLAKDAGGKLWMSTYTKGVWRYDGRKMTHFPVNDAGHNLKLAFVYNDRKGKLWLGTQEKGVYCFNGETFVPARF